ncbi:MAG: hypothetical protein U0105_26015 [Candidatus Obscuribacterales bacterium]
MNGGTRKSEFVRAYFRYNARHLETDSWAYEELFFKTQREPDEAWPIILQLIDAAISKVGLNVIAAGPLEELMQTHGAKMLLTVKQEAMKNARLMYCLSCFISSKEPVFSELRALVKASGITWHSPVEGVSEGNELELPE